MLPRALPIPIYDLKSTDAFLPPGRDDLGVVPLPLFIEPLTQKGSSRRITLCESPLRPSCLNGCPARGSALICFPGLRKFVGTVKCIRTDLLRTDTSGWSTVVTAPVSWYAFLVHVPRSATRRVGSILGTCRNPHAGNQSNSGYWPAATLISL